MKQWNAYVNSKLLYTDLLKEMNEKGPSTQRHAHAMHHAFTQLFKHFNQPKKCTRNFSITSLPYTGTNGTSAYFVLNFRTIAMSIAELAVRFVDTIKPTEIAIQLPS